MTGHALTRIYTAPKQQPADTTHRPSISTHTLAIGWPGGRTRGGLGPDVGHGCNHAWPASTSGRGRAGCWPGWGKNGRENTPSSPEA